MSPVLRRTANPAPAGPGTPPPFPPPSARPLQVPADRADIRLGAVPSRDPLSVVRRPPADLRLAPSAVAVPALASHVRPALVLPERHARALLEGAATFDVGEHGCFLAGPAGVQLWSGPWDGPEGGPGTSLHLGSIDWCYDTPNRHYCTIYRAMVTQAGVDAGESPLSVLGRVLSLAGLPIDDTRVSLPQPPSRDPFHRRPR